MRSSAKRKKVGRPRAQQRRPVLAARVPEEFFARIQASAVAHGRNASEELMWLAERGYTLDTALADANAIREKAFNEALTLLADAKRVASQEVKAELGAELQRRGYTYVRGMNGGAWFDPGVNAIQWIFDNSNVALVEELLDRVATRALEKMKARS